MTQAARDDNYVTSIQGVSSIDLSTPTPIASNPATGALLIDVAAPTEGNNGSYTITEVLVGTVTTTTIEKVIGVTTYTKTVVEDTSTGITTVSVWS